MKYDKEIVEDWINIIQMKALELTTWEEEFVESVKKQLEKKGSLSDKQIDILERIYAEKTPIS